MSTVVTFHDITPCSPDESCLAIHRAPPDFFKMDDCLKLIEICLRRPHSEENRPLDSTTRWNFQQGAHLQWLPGRSDVLAFSAVENGRAVLILRDVATGERKSQMSGNIG